MGHGSQAYPENTAEDLVKTERAQARVIENYWLNHPYIPRDVVLAIIRANRTAQAKKRQYSII